MPHTAQHSAPTCIQWLAVIN